MWTNSWDEIYNYGRFVELGESRVEGLHRKLWGTKGSYALLAFMGAYTRYTNTSMRLAFTLIQRQ